MRLIDADALELECMTSRDGVKRMAVSGEAISAAPAVEAEPVRHGEWLNRLSGMFEMGTCSICGEICHCVVGSYCPHCGAKMDAKAERR